MRIFCQEHQKSFFAPRQNPIRCENRGHTLSELDFDGQAKPPAETRWRYCCNCEHFCAGAFGQEGTEHCPVCSRQILALYLCDRCYTISFESDAPIGIKNFTLTSEGVPQPSCPGCLRPASADMREHTCDELGASFITGLNCCPICQERLDIGPSFPAAVAYYLRRTKARSKVNVTFDYESELFVPVEDGEFVLVRNDDENTPPIVLPRCPRFETERQFYDFYQDHYHCANPSSGEVQIIEPAAVDRVAGGWKVKAPGILEVLEGKSKKKAPAQVTRHQEDTSTREETKPSLEATKEERRLAPCAHCGSQVETRFAFCWNCGESLTLKNKPLVTPSEKTKATMPSGATATEKKPAKRYAASTRSPVFSWPKKERDGAWSEKGTMWNFIAVALAGLVLASFGLFVALRWVLSTPTRSAAPVTAQLAPVRSSAGQEEDELKQLRESRLGPGSVHPGDVLKAFAAAEKRYPNDYRFPYERAKVAAKADKTGTHDAAFGALSLAAERAIDSGKADEMLERLEADKDGDFNKLSHGRDEWRLLEQALRIKDKRMLGRLT